MRTIDIFELSFSNFKRRKLRSALTVMGVVIGTSSIVIMMSLGIGLNRQFEESLERMGNIREISIYRQWNPETGGHIGTFDDNMVAQLASIENVEAVAPEIRLDGGKFISGRYEWSYPQIKGINMDFAEQYGFVIGEGKHFDDTTISSSRTIYVTFGTDTPAYFQMPNKNSMGGGMFHSTTRMGMGMWGEPQEVHVNIMDPNTKIKYTFDDQYGAAPDINSDTITKKAPLYNVEPVALLGEGNSWETRYNAYVDLETAKMIQEAKEKFNRDTSGNLENNNNNYGYGQNDDMYSYIKIYANDINSVDGIIESVNAMGLEAYGAGSYLEEQKSQLAMIQLILGGIGSVSLLVAAIGITNTMIMSIYERTREIGIMKVIGCYLKDIRTMFLFEAGFIGLFGGIVGLGLSYSVSFIINYVVNKMGSGDMYYTGEEVSMAISVIPLWLALLSILFSIFIALLSGFFPANKAMKLSALEAMRV